MNFVSVKKYRTEYGDPIGFSTHKALLEDNQKVIKIMFY